MFTHLITKINDVVIATMSKDLWEQQSPQSLLSRLIRKIIHQLHNSNYNDIAFHEKVKCENLE